MRIGTIVSLLLCVGIAGISFAESTVDLDAPGAIEALARDHPAHYRKVMEELAKPQTYFILPVPVARDAQANERSQGSGSLVLPASLESRVSVEVDGTTYGVTLRATRNPDELKKSE